MKEWWTGDMLFDNLKNHKYDSWSKEKQWIQKLAEKKIGEKKEKKKEKASRKSQKLLKPKGKSKKPITLKTKRQG